MASFLFEQFNTDVDIILRGRLSISEEFANEFIAKTKGWHPEEQKCLHEVSVTPGEGSIWVDDRDHPLYRRSDHSYSKAKGHELDLLLRRHRPKHLDERAPYKP